MNEEKDKFSYAVIGLAMAAHRELGPGLDEIFYHELLAQKLKRAGIAHEFKPRGQLVHRGIVADEFVADLMVASELVLELKVLWGEFAPDHFMQIICYLKFWRLRAGLLLDFGKESLIQKRVVFTAPPAIFDVAGFVSAAPDFGSDRTVLGPLAEAVARILTEQGLGYRDTTYRGLLFAELKASGVPVLREPVTAIQTDDGVVGETKLPCLVIPERCAVSVVALRDDHRAADRAVLQTCLKHLQLPWGLVVNFGKRQLDCQFVVRPRS